MRCFGEHRAPSELPCSAILSLLRRRATWRFALDAMKASPQSMRQYARRIFEALEASGMSG
jgi:hypothetical protein